MYSLDHPDDSNTLSIITKTESTLFESSANRRAIIEPARSLNPCSLAFFANMTSLDLLGQLSQHWDVDLDKSLIDTVISRPPFVRIDGTFNARYITSDLDNSANVHDPESVNPLSIKPGYIYRGAVLSYLTEEGKAKIRDLGIKTIFDLRSDKERERDPEPEVEGVESRWFPSTKDEITLPSAIAAASGSARVSRYHF